MSDLAHEIRSNGKNGWCGYCSDAADEIERLRSELKNALAFGVWSMAGPTNSREEDEVDKWVEAAWVEYCAKTPIDKPSGAA
jgi:hypothetical protein